MEVATTNNHSQSHHHHHHAHHHHHHHAHHQLNAHHLNRQHLQQTRMTTTTTTTAAAAATETATKSPSTATEITTATAKLTATHAQKSNVSRNNNNNKTNSNSSITNSSSSVGIDNGARSPFQREVREWQRIDPDTGALLTGRLEADRWINGNMNSSYGKISDSQNISQPNGTQHTQRKQLEVLQARTANGAMQVIRAQTVQTTSSRWSSTISSELQHTKALAAAAAEAAATTTTAATTATAITSAVATTTKQAQQTINNNINSNNNNNNNNMNNNNNNNDSNNVNMLHSSASSLNSLYNQQYKHLPNPHLLFEQKLNKSTTTNPTTNNTNAKIMETDETTVIAPYKRWSKDLSIQMSTLDISEVKSNNDANNNSGGNSNSSNNINGHSHANDHNDSNIVVANVNELNVYNDDNDDFANDNFDEQQNKQQQQQQQCFLINDFDSIGSNSNFSKRHTLFNSNNNNNNNNNSNIKNIAHNNNNNDVNSNLLLLDAVPSLKLSNLMKSSSNISSNNGNNATITTTTTPTIKKATARASSSTATTSTTTMNTHNAMGKISLHAIVGTNPSHNNNNNENNNNNNNNNITKVTKAKPGTNWQNQQQQQKSMQSIAGSRQPTIFGNSNNLQTKSRVGVHGSNSSINNDNNCCMNTVDSDDIVSEVDGVGHVGNCGDSSDDGFAVGCCGSGGGGGGGGNVSGYDGGTAFNGIASFKAVDDHQRRQYQHQQQHHHHHHNHHNHLQFKRQNDRLTPTQENRQPRLVDLESFRQYNQHEQPKTIKTKATTQTANAAAKATTTTLQTIINDKRNGVGDTLFRTHQRRSQYPMLANTPFQRSISTDDLSSEWNNTNNDSDEETGEWRRVSKLRRSFQLTSTSSDLSTTTTTSTKLLTTAASKPKRPIDLPASSVSVSKIRAELENGRRLNTAMRNNHVDLAALNDILNSPTSDTNNISSKPIPAKRSSFLTAESLKEIRNKLKRLSDETLYKEDFHQQLPVTEEQIVQAAHIIRKPAVTEYQRTRQLTPEELPEITSTTPPPQSAFRHYIASKVSTVSPIATTARPVYARPKNATNSLEIRQKLVDKTSNEWHMRRKSYGFEKMSPPDERTTMFRMDASTDSGLGRSGELGNWSPTEANPLPTATARGTVIHFGGNNGGGGTAGGNSESNVTPYVRRRNAKQLKSVIQQSEETNEVIKRHSIAVTDEKHLIRDNNNSARNNATQIHLNGFREPITTELTTLRTSPNNNNNNINNMETHSTRPSQQKRVGFCKTEVHFAAESGRVNIVETDGKPPPTQNFRRRRRLTGGSLPTLTTAIDVTTTTPIKGDINESAETADTPIITDMTTNVTVTIPKVLDTQHIIKHENIRNSYTSTTSTSGVDTTDNENDELSVIRGILKNKPIKPKPYHLGDNIENSDVLWGLHLKPTTTSTTLISRGDSFTKADKVESPTFPTATHTTVAERVRIVEQQQQHQEQQVHIANGFSTKINLSLNDLNKDWHENGTQNLMQRRHLTNNAQELMLQDLKVNQRTQKDKGLKSTSLIIKTMRSATEFDEAMRRLSIASLESATVVQTPAVVVPTPIVRANSYQDSTTTTTPVAATTNTHKYSIESIATENIKSDTVVDSGITTLKVSTHLNNSNTNNNNNNNNNFQTINSYIQHIQPPQPPPRLKYLNNTQMTVSQQLQQLRRMYDIAAGKSNGAQNVVDDDDDEEEDSADEEVKSYFRNHQAESITITSDSGGGTQDSSSLEDDYITTAMTTAKSTGMGTATVCSGSWSRLKAKRTVWKIEAVECKEILKPMAKADLPKSNIMNIELHSPPMTLEKPKFKALSPIGKMNAINNNSTQLQHLTNIAATTTDTTTADSLKIVKEARGARKLRDHELSYFGVQVDKNENSNLKTRLLPNTNLSNATPRRTLPQRRNNEDYQNNNKSTKSTSIETDLKTLNKTTTVNKTTKWQLINDKPDLLRHSPITVEPQILKRNANVNNRTTTTNDIHSVKNDHYIDDEHLYENVTNELTPVFKVTSHEELLALNSYDRRTDLKRDAMILSEMNKNADQTLKSLTDESTSKDQRRRSLQRRNSKPLETISEKSTNEKVTDKCIAVTLTRGTFASEAKRTARHGSPSPARHSHSQSHNLHNRSSSQSSIESCPRARSRSLSSEREYESLKVKPATRSHTTSAAGKTKEREKKSGSRSSSLDSRHSHSSHTQCSSDAEDRQKRKERVKRTNLSASAEKIKRHKEQHERKGERPRRQTPIIMDEKRHATQQQQPQQQQQRQRSSARSTKTGGCTMHSSQQREHIQCAKNTHGTTNDTPSSGSMSRRRRDEQHDLHKSVRSSSGDRIAMTAAAAAAVIRRSSNEKHQHRQQNEDSRDSRAKRHAMIRHVNELTNETTQQQQRKEQRTEKEKLSRSKGQSNRSTQYCERHHTTSLATRTTREHRGEQHEQNNSAIASNSPVATINNYNSLETRQNDDNIITNSKNAHYQSCQTHGAKITTKQALKQQQQQQQQHMHSLTTATIAARQQRERHGKDRK